MAILIRSDSSSTIGGGHIKRCLTLAREFKRRKKKIYFLCKKLKGNLISEINKEFSVIKIPCSNYIEYPMKTNRPAEVTKRELEYNDSEYTINIIKKLGISKVELIILDSYTLGNEWIKNINENFKSEQINLFKSLYIKDLNELSSSFTYTLNQNKFYSKELELTGEMTGLNYILLDKSYLRHKNKQTNKEIKNILLFIGSSDIYNIIPIFLEIFKHEAFFKYNINVVISKISSNCGELKKIIAGIPNIKLHLSLPSLSKLILDSDFIIGSAGTNTWERLYYNKPALVIKLAENQNEVIKTLKKTKSAFIIDSISFLRDKASLTKTLLNLLNDKESIRQVELNCKPLVDGFGTDRVAFKLCGLQTNTILRPASRSDAILFFNWYNDSKIRRQSISKEVVSFHQHLVWFNQKLNSDKSRVFVFEDQYGTPLGYIRFDENVLSRTIYLSYSLDEIARGLGLSYKLVYSGLKMATKIWNKGFSFTAIIKDTNLPSIKIVTKLGFQLVKRDLHNFEFLKFCLYNSENLNNLSNENWN